MIKKLLTVPAVVFLIVYLGACSSQRGRPEATGDGDAAVGGSSGSGGGLGLGGLGGLGAGGIVAFDGGSDPNPDQDASPADVAPPVVAQCKGLNDGDQVCMGSAVHRCEDGLTKAPLVKTCAAPTPACMAGQCGTCEDKTTRPCSESGLLGPCAAGTQTCNAGVWGACSRAPAAKDTCEADNDDDCDGTKNKGCACVNGATAKCKDALNRQGACGGDPAICIGGQWSGCLTTKGNDTCNAGIENGSDNNCNGTPNEGCVCVNGSSGTCGASTCGYTGQCVSGACQTIATGTQCAAESCSGSMLTAVRSCAAFGQCGTASPTACPKYLTCLDGSSCRSSCGSTSDCTDGRQCWQGECMRKMTVSLDFDKATSHTVYQDGSLESFYFGTIYVGDVPPSSPPLVYRRGFFSWKIGKLPIDTRKIVSARFKVAIFNSGGNFGGDLRDLGPLVVEHVRYDTLGLAAFNAQPFQTLGAPEALTSTLVVPPFGPNENVTIEVGSAVANEFSNHTHVQFRFRPAGKDTNNDGVYDGLTLDVGGSALEVDVLRP